MPIAKLLAFKPIAAGAGLSPGGGGNFNGPIGVNGLQAAVYSTDQIQFLACTIIDWLFWGLMILAVIFVLVSAYRYVTSSGDPEKVHSAGRTLVFASVAIVVALFAGGLPALVGSFFNIYGVGGCSAFGGLLGLLGL